MKEENINIIIQNAINSRKYNNIKNENNIIENIKKSIIENFSLFERTNKIDLKNKNGFLLELNIIEKILDRYINIIPRISIVNESIITKDNLLISKVYKELGIIQVIFNGDTYIMLEMILLGIITHNTIIFTYNGYMQGSNGLLISIIESILEKEGYNKKMFQHTYSIKAEDLFDNFKTINKTIIIGETNFQNKYIKLSNNEVLVSGYNNYDLYIEDDTHIDLINNILNTNYNIDVYINSNININYVDAIYVEDIDEAISRINYNTSGYSSSIFTNNKENASKFMKNINSKNIFVNASPTLEQRLDIKEEDLLKTTNLILPNMYND